MRLAFDLDGTLCVEGKGSERMFAAVNFDNRDLVNRAYREGHEVFIFTARPWSDYQMTLWWLRENGFNFTALVCGKLNYDKMLCDRSTDDAGKFRREVFGD
jgi:hydroxymethylpyrimidine pyrophosphatase-like HAD family hydrolase